MSARRLKLTRPYKGRINGPCSACGDGDTAVKYHDHEVSSPSYTLAELMELGHEWARSTGGELTDDMAVSWFLLWLAKKEKEANDETIR